MYLGPINPDNPASITVQEIVETGNLVSSFDNTRIYEFHHNLENTTKYALVFINEYADTPASDFSRWEDAVACAVEWEQENINPI